MNYKISVIICTHNRFELLSKTLKKLQEQTIFDQIEIILVDNASTDLTKTIPDLFPFVKYHLEEKKGLSFARNKGLKVAQAPVIIFLDDDAYPVHRTWAENYLMFFQTSHERCYAAGGEVLPDFEIKPAEWILKDRKLLDFLSVLEFEQSRTIKSTEWLVGANVAYKKALFTEVGLFNTSLGRKGKSLLSNEETEIQNKALISGKEFYFLKGVAVKHFIHAERLSLRWFIKRIYWQGRSDKITSPRKTRYEMIRAFASSVKWLFHPKSTVSGRLDIFYKIGRYL